MTTAQDRGWGPAYPGHCTTARSRCVTVESAGCDFIVRGEIAGLIAAFTAAWHRTVEPLDPAQCWSFACRAVRGSTAPSNHSWGLALDLNSAKHPLGSVGSFSQPQVRAIRALLARPEFRNFRWGGDYRSRKDEMHVEYLGTPAQAIADSRLLGGAEEDDMDEATLRRVAREVFAEVINDVFTASGSTDAEDSVDDDRVKINTVATRLTALAKDVAEVKAMLVQQGAIVSPNGDFSGEYTATFVRKA